jgi:hypothetical protein
LQLAKRVRGARQDVNEKYAAITTAVANKAAVPVDVVYVCTHGFFFFCFFLLMGWFFLYGFFI